MKPYQTFRFVLMLTVIQVSAWAQTNSPSKNSPTLLASLHSTRNLVWHRVSPSAEKPDGPVLYQLLFSGSGTPGTVPVFDTNPRHLSNSPITVSGNNITVTGTATVGGFQLSTGAGAGKVLTSDGAGVGTWQPVGAGVVNITANSGLTATPNPITGTGTIGIANAGVTTAMIGDGSVTVAKLNSGAATNGQVLAANGSSGASWQTLNPALTNAWGLGGNTGIGCTVSPCSTFFGTTDGSNIEFRVSNNRALRIEPATDASLGFAPNMIGGFSGNVVTGPGVAGATIAGGGASTAQNTVSTSFATVSGGFANTASGYDATVSGGEGNTTSNRAATIAGGEVNHASGVDSTVAAGFFNTASGDFGFAAGYTVTASGHYSTVTGGGNNLASKNYASVGGGFGNTASGVKATIAGGGRTNDSDPNTGNRVKDDFGTVGGGGNNQAGDNAGINPYATVAGGQQNTASGNASTVAGGNVNTASGNSSAIAGGSGNTASGFESTVAGGFGNVASGQYSFVGGGQSNTTNDYSFAAGQYAKAQNNSSFVWCDGSPGPAGCQTVRDRDFVVVSTGSFRVYANPGYVEMNGGTQTCTLTGSSGGWSCSSDRNLKENFHAIDGRDVLRRVIQMPISQWSFKNVDPTIHHLGPTAQDFYAAFRLGNDDKTIGSTDAQGVAFAAIQGLNQKLEDEIRQKDSQIAELKNELKKQMEAMQDQIKALLAARK